VARERLHIDDPVPPSSWVLAGQIGAIIPAVMKKLGLESHHWLSTLEEEWPKLAGPDVAAHTRPGQFESKRLTVYVDSPVWLHELSRTGRGPLLANLRKRYGVEKMREVRFRLDPDDATEC